MNQSLIVLDTSVLINFLRIDRMDLLKQYNHEFVVTDHASAEITDFYAAQRSRLLKAISDGILLQETIHRAEEMSVFSTLTALGTLGSGECSAIASAVCRGCALAIDDRRAANQARNISQDISILRTQDMLASMVTQGLLNWREAEAIRDTWARKHRFIIKDSPEYMGLDRRNTDDGITGEEAMYLCRSDIERCHLEAHRIFTHSAKANTRTLK